MNCKKASEIIKSNYPPENYTILREALDWLLEQAKRVERYEMMYDNTGAMFNRMTMKEKIVDQQKEIEDYKSALESIQHYTVDKKCAYCHQVYEYARRARHGEKLKKYEKESTQAETKKPPYMDLDDE
jgi:hypothetical protein